MYALLKNNLLHGEIQPKEVIGVKINNVIISDNTSFPILKYLAEENKYQTNQTINKFLILTNAPYQLSPEYSEIQPRLISEAKKLGFIIIKDLNGLWHHQIKNQKDTITPNTINISTDSTVNFFAYSDSLNISVGVSDMIKVLVKGCLDYLVPEIYKISLNGILPNSCTIKDLALYLIKKMQNDLKNKYVHFEFSGDLIEKLSEDEKAILSIHHYALNAQSFTFTTQNNSSSVYAKEFKFDISKITPNVKNDLHVFNAEELSGMNIDKVIIGNTIGGTLNDLQLLSQLLKNKTVKIPCYVSPASNDIFLQALDLGLISTIAKSGCTIITPGATRCTNTNSIITIKGENILATGIDPLVTTSRTKDSSGNIFTSSIKTAIASALQGKLTTLKESNND